MPKVERTEPLSTTCDYCDKPESRESGLCKTHLAAYMRGVASGKAAKEAEAKYRVSFLTVLEAFKLNEACKAITNAFGNTVPYLVGSVMTKPDYHDVDVRLILDDGDYERLAMFGSKFLLLTNAAYSAYLSAMTGLPIDFQIQKQSEANAKFDGPRNALGMQHV